MLVYVRHYAAAFRQDMLLAQLGMQAPQGAQRRSAAALGHKHSLCSPPVAHLRRMSKGRVQSDSLCSPPCTLRRGLSKALGHSHSLCSLLDLRSKDITKALCHSHSLWSRLQSLGSVHGMWIKRSPIGVDTERRESSGAVQTTSHSHDTNRRWKWKLESMWSTGVGKS
jgi:hypothetical protein